MNIGVQVTSRGRVSEVKGDRGSGDGKLKPPRTIPCIEPHTLDLCMQGTETKTGFAPKAGSKHLRLA